MAAITMPRWSEMEAAPTSSAVQPTSVSAPAGAGDRIPAATARPAHLNLDVRHNFRNVELFVTVDGKTALETRLAGSGKRFGVIGKRAERGFTRTLDVTPGTHVVRVRLRSAADKFDQTRVERFDLDSAAVASLRISADKSGLSVAADRPALPVPLPAAVAHVAPPGPATVMAQGELTKAAYAAQAAQSAREASAIAELYQSLRSILIAVAGFIASAATGFLVESFLRTRRALQFAAHPQPSPAAAVDRRRRRRERRPPRTPIPSQ